MLVALLTAFYMFRVVFLAFFGAPAAAGHPHQTGTAHAAAAMLGAGAPAVHGLPDGASHGGPAHAGHAHDPGPVMAGPLWLLAALSMLVGVATTLDATLATRVLEPGAAEPHAAPTWLMPAAIGVAVTGIALAWLTYQRGAIAPAALAGLFGPVRRAALARFWIDDFFEGVLGALLFAGSRAIGWLDRYLVDGVLNAVSAWTVFAGDRLRQMQTGRAQDYVYGVGAGLFVLILWLRWVLA
jgi:NADH-quinone oxidoreductase subunit L